MTTTTLPDRYMDPILFSLFYNKAAILAKKLGWAIEQTSEGFRVNNFVFSSVTELARWLSDCVSHA